MTGITSQERNPTAGSAPADPAPDRGGRSARHGEPVRNPNYQCTGKARYKSRALAKAVARRTATATAGVCAREYECPHCDSWHVGTFGRKGSPLASSDARRQVVSEAPRQRGGKRRGRIERDDHELFDRLAGGHRQVRHWTFDDDEAVR